VRELQGVWAFPDREVAVVTQCKNEKKPVGVQYVREFHGVLSLLPAGTLGLFASSSGYSIYAQRCVSVSLSLFISHSISHSIRQSARAAL
jgi:hypothetical protein